jgi:hypothetical protein
MPTTCSSRSSSATCSSSSSSFSKEVVDGVDGVEERLADLGVRVARAEQRALLGVVGPRAARLVLEELVPGEERRPEGPARVARRGLDPDLLEGSLAQHAAVGDAVERDAPGHRRGCAHPSACGCSARSCSTISSVTAWIEAAMSISRWVIAVSALARRAAEEVVHLRRRHHVAVAVVEVRHVHPEGAVGLQVEELLEDPIGL